MSRKGHNTVHLGGGCPWPDDDNLPLLVGPQSQPLGFYPQSSKHTGFSAEPTARLRVPYITKQGKFSGCYLYNWVTTPSKLQASVITTVYKRLQWLTQRRKINHDRLKAGDRIVYDLLIYRVAAYYVITQNNYFLDRFLALSQDLRKNKKTVEGLLCHKLSQLSDSNWLNYRAAALLSTALSLRRKSFGRDKLSLKLMRPLPPQIQRGPWEKRSQIESEIYASVHASVSRY